MLRLKRNVFLILILFITFLFILIQFIFVNDLKSHNNSIKNPKIDQVNRFQEFKIRNKNSKSPDKNKQEIIKDVTTKFLGIENENRLIDSKKLIENDKKKDLNIRGIDKNKQHLYIPNNNGQFKCLNSHQMIPYENMNDNYCDCADGSDEPGTNACYFSKFYCTTQNEFLANNFIPSSRVDDKICDCCDGSDEKPEINCKNTCSSLVEKKLEFVELQRKGLAEKKKYLVDGIFKDEKMYGPKGVFFRLSKECFEISWSSFSFKVCPFKEVTQIDHSRTHINIGRTPNLKKKNSNDWVLEMKGGDSRNCPQSRSSEINLKCGINDELLSVQEPQKCLYVFFLNTPAAC